MSHAAAQLRSVFLLISLALLPSCDSKPNLSGDSERSGEKQITIGMVPRSQYGPWTLVREASLAESQKIRAILRWNVPEKPNDSVMQYRALLSLRELGFDALVISPVDMAGIQETIRKTAETKPVILFDCDVAPPFNVTSIVGTDNARVGAMAAEQMMELTGERDVVVTLTSKVLSTARTESEHGFYDKLLQNRTSNRIEMTACDNTEPAVTAVMEGMLKRHPETRGIFAPDRDSSQATLRWLRRTNVPGRIHFVGFGFSREMLKGMDEGYVDALLIADMAKISRQAVNTAAEKVRGQNVLSSQLVAPILITKANKNDPALQPILQAGFNEEGN